MGDAQEHEYRGTNLINSTIDILGKQRREEALAERAQRTKSARNKRDNTRNQSFPQIDSDDQNTSEDLSNLSNEEKERLIYLRRKYKNTGEAMGSSPTEWEQLMEQYREKGIDESFMNTYLSEKDKELLELAELERKILG